MRARAAALVLAGLLLGAGRVCAAGNDAFTFGGYIRESAYVWQEPEILGVGASHGTNVTNLLHTRQNLKFYPVSWLTGGLELKTRLFNGESARELQALSNGTGGNRDYFDWEWKLAHEARTVLVMVPDRLWLSSNAGPWQVTVGRQRVAWGTALVWNPIDLFNPSSPLDFEDQELPGTDAGRAQLYLGPNSKLELAVAPTRNVDDAVVAAQLVVNFAGYDWVVLGGRRGPNALLGGAWAGSIRGGGCRGELLYTIPRDNLTLAGSLTPEHPGFVGTVDGDYTFASTLYLHTAVLYNQLGTTGDGGRLPLLEAYRRRWLSPARLSIFGEAGRDLGALVHVDLGGILNPYDRSWYVGPSLRWSMVTNLDVSAQAFVFGGEPGTEFGDDGGMGSVSVKYSF